MIGDENQKRSVLPVLLAGDMDESLPPQLRSRLHADFRNDEAYFRTAFELILSLY